MALSHLVPDVPMLTTMHCLITPDTQFVWDRYPGYYNTISHSQFAMMPKVAGGTYSGVVHNGIDVASFPFQAEKDDHLLFLSRFAPEKGPEVAVEVARRCGKKLILAGKVDPLDHDFFVNTIAPLIDGERVVFVGEADAKTKRELYKAASCVLMPITWEEPFGLVMAEAQACGTPVLAFDRGAAAEIVQDGVTGFVVDSEDEMVAAVARVNEISPIACRQHIERHFGRQAMAEGYLRVYQAILERRRAGQSGDSPSGKALPQAERPSEDARPTLVA
jgi:glycosyltransferase involved in cell wall biosynthesis